MTHKSPNMAMGFLVGLGIGATAGILLAPRKGEETRRQIQQKAVQARDRVKQQISKRKDEITDQINEGIDTIAETAHGLTSMADDNIGGPSKGQTASKRDSSGREGK